MYPIFYEDKFENFKTFAWDLSYLIRTYFFISLEIIFFAIFKFSKDYFTEYLKRESIQKEISEVKLRMLKAQLHPHFLFNTLNNIYSLSLDCKNKQLSESINKLSEILRFSLYDCNSKFISLKKELSVIKNYIELERLRYSNLEVNIDLPLNTEGFYTIPLLYFTFIENAFKHGTSKSAINKWIDIRLKIMKEDILFTVKNGKSEIKQKDRLNYSKGIGLENARKRLDLYFGNKNYSLVVKDLSNSFEIELLHKRIDNYDKMLNS
jgi:LytS/YehU family sensor histidine kinase